MLVGDIKIENVDNEYYRLTVETATGMGTLDGIEVTGTSLAEALEELHEQVERIEGQ